MKKTDGLAGQKKKKRKETQRNVRKGLEWIMVGADVKPGKYWHQKVKKPNYFLVKFVCFVRKGTEGKRKKWAESI